MNQFKCPAFHQVWSHFSSHVVEGKLYHQFKQHFYFSYTLPKTNIAMENPPFWWYLQGNMGIFMGYVSFREGIFHRGVFLGSRITACHRPSVGSPPPWHQRMNLEYPNLKVGTLGCRKHLTSDSTTTWKHFLTILSNLLILSNLI